MHQALKPQCKNELTKAHWAEAADDGSTPANLGGLAKWDNGSATPKKTNPAASAAQNSNPNHSRNENSGRSSGFPSLIRPEGPKPSMSTATRKIPSSQM